MHEFWATYTSFSFPPKTCISRPYWFLKTVIKQNPSRMRAEIWSGKQLISPLILLREVSKNSDQYSMSWINLIIFLDFFSVGNLMPCINSAMNFLIYMLRGKKFRDAFKSTYEPELNYLQKFCNSCRPNCRKNSCFDHSCNEFHSEDQSAENV